MADDLYDRDFLAWTEAQAAALRARRSGDNALDYDNLAEEIEDVGRSELNSCLSFAELIVEHLLKLEFADNAETSTHWRKEVRAFRRNLARRLTPSIEQRVRAELPGIFAGVKHDLVEEGAIDPARAAEAQGYSWEQVTNIDWFPAQG